MEISWGFFACCCIGLYFSGALCSSDKGGSRPWLISAGEDSEPLRPSGTAENSYSQLPSLLKALDCPRNPEGKDGARIPPPLDSTALSYMKRLYRGFGTSKVDRNQLYNIVRLITPHAECKYQTAGHLRGDLRSVDLLFNLDSVTSLERLFKSVLFYSLDKPVFNASAINCTCSLIVKQRDSTDQACCSLPRTVHVQLRRRRIEIDVTTFLQPLVASNKRSIQIAANFTCLKDPKSLNSKWDLFDTALVSPSLLLFLNGTSEQNSLIRDMKPMWCGLKNSPFMGPREETGRNPIRVARASQHRRSADGEVEQSAISPSNFSHSYPLFHFSPDECNLRNLWVEFSQLQWDRWIIAPYSYNFQYCQGECPSVARHRYGSAPHPMVQNIIDKKLDSPVPRPSCMPAEFSPLRVLRLEDDGSIVYKQYENVIAARCVCV